MSEKMREALKLAEAALFGANMNMNVVKRKIREALAEQPAQGEAAANVAKWDEHMRVVAELNAARATIQKLTEQPAQGEASLSPEDVAEQFIQAAIDRAPEPLRRLGEYLTRVLDEDEWKTAESMLLGAAERAAPEVPRG